MSSNIRLTVALREGVVSGLVQNRRALKGGATLALIAILAALTALLLIILIALAFICRHKKVRNRLIFENVKFLDQMVMKIHKIIFSPFDTQLLTVMEILLKVQKAMIKIVAATKLTILSKFMTMYLFYTIQF